MCVKTTRVDIFPGEKGVYGGVWLKNKYKNILKKYIGQKLI